MIRPRRLAVSVTAQRDGGVAVLRGRVTVALIGSGGTPPAPDEAAALPATADSVAGPVGLDQVAEVRVPPGTRPEDALAPWFVWPWRAGYPYCRYSDRVAHAGFVRALEEVVDRFLDHRGLSVATVFADRGYVPVVSPGCG